MRGLANNQLFAVEDTGAYTSFTTGSIFAALSELLVPSMLAPDYRLIAFFRHGRIRSAPRLRVRRTLPGLSGRNAKVGRSVDKR